MEWLYFIFFCGSCLVGLKLAFEWGFFERFKWYRTLKFAILTVNGIIRRLAKMKDPQAAASCTINDTDKSASIVYSRNGRDKLINVPYNKNLRMKMNPFKVLLVTGDKSKDITQEPGMPYLCSAKQLGAHKIIAQNKLDNSILTFEGQIVPGYLGLENLFIESNKIEENNLS